MKKKLMATTMIFAICAMASSAFASQGAIGQIKTNVGIPSNVSISNAVSLHAVPLNTVNSNVGNFAATATVSHISTAEKAKQLGITVDELMKYYAKYYQLDVNKPNQIKTQAEMAKIKAEQKSSPIYKLIQQWEQKQMMQVIDKK
ncbi:hypothetical protein O0555_05645 [Brevibacillus laterosporus]|uniref:hypothetical protein n=1 Tax=Brevibacillus laterosporus TaxID=1465 RepID=UPI0018CDBF1F|nr:hypothetical protein [Brevibacillus laterosporus]MBG9798203.1 hypothetical protein [Brevibacillus laterosporus]MCR8936834.1 hypothetical protein [Brevibacillus laterosporus]MCZ0839473.1 hypothetical protein [Brevibacillus laterosporus]MCZ0845409.1 hypothetical protein [Brevibacillus laterosporus]MED1912143.1 hypothetical protein [Brevibacillus laterosporus]